MQNKWEHLDEMGSTVSTSVTSVSAKTGGYTQVASITIPSNGRWFIYARVRFASNTTGFRGAYLATSSAASGSPSVTTPASDGAVNLNVGSITGLNAGTTYYLNVYQTSGAALNVTYAGLVARKIGERYSNLAYD